MKTLSLILLLTMPAWPDSVTVGTANSENCIPFASCAGANVIVYQQVYSSSAFSGDTEFNEVTFFGAPLFLGDELNTATYDISFSTTQKSVRALDTDYATNVGADSQEFGSFSVAGATPSELAFTGDSFNYDPSTGNLLMQIVISDILVGVNAGAGAFEADDGADGLTSRLIEVQNGFTSTDDLGLVTEFSENASPVPEPVWGPLLIGLFLAIGVSRRRVVAERQRHLTVYED
jgi:hypothetical protein